ncbi:pentatricopeptide repeat-containing protein [Tanacetum coccineum]
MTGFDRSACLKCGGVVDGRKVFDEMTERDVVSWNSVVYGNVKMGWMNKARELSDEMPEKLIVCFVDCHDFWPDWISLLLVLPAFAQSGALKLGKWVHFYVEKNVFMLKTSVCNALIEMYAESGSVDQAWQVIDNMVERDVISWSTLIP